MVRKVETFPPVTMGTAVCESAGKGSRRLQTTGL